MCCRLLRALLASSLCTEAKGHKSKNTARIMKVCLAGSFPDSFLQNICHSRVFGEFRVRVAWRTLARSTRTLQPRPGQKLQARTCVASPRTLLLLLLLRILVLLSDCQEVAVSLNYEPPCEHTCRRSFFPQLVLRKLLLHPQSPSLHRNAFWAWLSLQMKPLPQAPKTSKT